MDKQALIRDMKRTTNNGGFINQTQLAKYLRVSKEVAREMLVGLEYLPTGRERKYFVEDVASQIMSKRKLS